MCWFTGKRIPLLDAEFAHPRPAGALEYGHVFAARPVR
jgi:hypothetical protein